MQNSKLLRNNVDDKSVFRLPNIFGVLVVFEFFIVRRKSIFLASEKFLMHSISIGIQKKNQRFPQLSQHQQKMFDSEKFKKYMGLMKAFCFAISLTLTPHFLSQSLLSVNNLYSLDGTFVRKESQNFTGN